MAASTKDAAARAESFNIPPIRFSHRDEGTEGLKGNILPLNTNPNPKIRLRRTGLPSAAFTFYAASPGLKSFTKS